MERITELSTVALPRGIKVVESGSGRREIFWLAVVQNRDFSERWRTRRGNQGSEVGFDKSCHTRWKFGRVVRRLSNWWEVCRRGGKLPLKFTNDLGMYLRILDSH